MKAEEVIKNAIDDKGMKITFVAEKTGMTVNSLSQSLNCKRNLKSYELIAICLLLGLDMKDFSFIFEQPCKQPAI